MNTERLQSQSDDDERLGGDRSEMHLLQRAMASMRGHATSASLESIYEVAQGQFGFSGSIGHAAMLLAELPDVRIEEAPTLKDYRVHAEIYWSPSGKCRR